MKKIIITLSLLSILSTTVVAGTLKQDRSQLDAEMATLQTPIAEQGFIQVDFDASYEEVTYSGYVIDVYAETYISRHKAKELGLEKIEKFHIYSLNNNLDKLSDEIANRIDQDKPAFFSVDLYKDYFGDSGSFRYVARVIEYK